jgi:uncharacterized protein
VWRLPISEVSAKVRAGGPLEEPEDLALPHWGGEIPLTLAAGTPVADGQSEHATEVAMPRTPRATAAPADLLDGFLAPPELVADLGQ